MQGECVYFNSAQGCRRGDACMFVHANKFVAKTPTCSFHAQGHCQRGNSCKFAHDAAPVTLNTYYVEQEPIQRSGEQCRFFLSGSCIKGNKCTFVHEVERKPIQNHKADSDTNTKLEDVRNKGLGNLGNICVFFLRGVCTKVNCPFLHPVEQDELEPFEAVKAHQSVHIEELKSNERTVLGLTRCVFGAGAEVLQVITNPRSLLFQTKGMIGVSEGEILAILSRFGTLKSFEYKQDGDSATTLKGFAKASFESIEPTKAAMEALKNTPHAIEFVTDVLKRKSKSGDVTQTRYLKAQWFGKAPHVAYAHFRTRAAAERAVQFCQGNRRYLSVTFQRPTPHQRTSFTAVIQFTGKPLTSNDFFCLFKKNNIHEFMGATVTVAKESASNAEVRKFLEDRGGPIESFTPQSSPGVHGAGGVGGKLKALVRFVDAQGAARAAALNGRHHEELRGSMLYLTPFFSCKFAVLRDLWAVLGEELLSLQAAIEVNNAGIVKFHVFPTEHSVTVRLSSSDPRELASARVMIEAVLKGEILHTSDGAGMGAGAGGGAAGVGANRLVPLWHETFAGPQGISLLKSFSAAASSPVFLLREENRRLVRCYGKPSDVALCRQAVLAYLAQYSQVVRSIPVKQPNLLNALLREGRLVELQRHSGAVARPIINFATMCLQVTGDNTVEQRAISFVLNLAAELKSAKPATTPTAPTADAKADSTEDEPICPICMCPVETGDTKQLECGHSYCIGCFDQYLAQAHSSYDAKFPLRCLHEHCGAPIPLFELEAALDIEQTAQMYRTALKCYVKQHPDRCNFCITPNCEQVYTWEGPADLVVQCSTCFASICTACKVEYHEGLTCAQYEERRNGGEAAYLQWKAAHNVKACPKCGVDIEKSEGCNHMQCANCKIHICWVCLKTFTDGRLTYDHMSSAHGGFFAQG